MISILSTHSFAAAYGPGQYGSCQYDESCQGAAPRPEATGSEQVNAPLTGYLSNPVVMAPTIFGLAVTLALVILVLRRLYRRFAR